MMKSYICMTTPGNESYSMVNLSAENLAQAKKKAYIELGTKKGICIFELKSGDFNYEDRLIQIIGDDEEDDCWT